MFFTLIFCLFSTVLFLSDAFAQTGKGSMLLGGNAGINFSSERSDDKSFGMSLYPQAGFFVANSFALGASVSLGYSSYNTNSTRTNNIGLGPFVRYYLGSGKALPFLEARGGWGRYQSRYEEPGGVERKYTDHIGYGGLGIGLAYFLTPSVGLEPLLSYDIYGEDSYTRRTLNFRIGFQVYFSRKGE